MWYSKSMDKAYMNELVHRLEELLGDKLNESEAVRLRIEELGAELEELELEVSELERRLDDFKAEVE